MYNSDMFAILFTILLATLAVFQLALAAGAPLGRFAWGGQHTVLPRKLRIASIFSILIYVLMSVVALSRAEVVTTISHQPTVSVMVWVIAAYMTLGIVMNAISRSKQERYVMTPIALVLAVLAIFIAQG